MLSTWNYSFLNSCHGAAGAGDWKPGTELGNGLWDPGDKIGAGKLIVLVLYDPLITGPQGWCRSARAVVASVGGSFAHTWASHVVFRRPPPCPEMLTGEEGYGLLFQLQILVRLQDRNALLRLCWLSARHRAQRSILAFGAHLQANAGKVSCPITVALVLHMVQHAGSRDRKYRSKPWPQNLVLWDL